MSPTVTRLINAGLLLSLGGCMEGTILEATTQQPIEGVSVYVIDGQCDGEGCNTDAYNGYPRTYSNNKGVFLFDAQPGENRQLIRLTEGKEALQIGFEKTGYRPITLFYDPKYVTNSDGGQYSRPPKIFMCPTDSVDSDNDTLCDDAEAHYRTNPNARDSDGDGISDAAEIYGVSGMDLRHMGADPNRKDIFVEIDYYPDFKPTQDILDQVITAFANAPINNRNGVKGIKLHFDLDQEIAEADIDSNLDPVTQELRALKRKYFNAHREPVFHYSLFADRYNSSLSSGVSIGTPGKEFAVTLGGFPTRGGKPIEQAGTLMHELGHNLGLRHGGYESANRKFNYFSIMSYSYQLHGLRIGERRDVVDFSRIRVAPVDESELYEPEPLQALSPSTTAELSQYKVRANYRWLEGSAHANLDINRDGVINTDRIAVDLNSDSDTNDRFNSSQTDWDKLVYLAGRVALTDMERASGATPQRQQVRQSDLDQYEMCVGPEAL